MEPGYQRDMVRQWASGPCCRDVYAKRKALKDCPGCGAPKGYPPAGPCDKHGTPEAKAL
jgi:hypothetical protein